ncbi:NUDIX domain-containing protein [Chelatococcus sp. GCM10030263]|uniref:NUDIX hydrolase n=1 Tax=Chelatococcus sp. GCM10030263 TaxID=3273387 RepID=UPI00361604FE
MPNPPATIRIAAALLADADGRLLLVRKRGTRAFMQAGGKLGPSEEPLVALVRELDEELGLRIDPSEAIYLGRFEAPAAHEPGFVVHADLFSVGLHEEVRPAAEIDEVIWLDPSRAGEIELAPLTRDHVLPLHARFRAGRHEG